MVSIYYHWYVLRTRAATITLGIFMGSDRTVHVVKDWSENLGPSFSGEDPQNIRRTAQIQQLLRFLRPAMIWVLFFTSWQPPSISVKEYARIFVWNQRWGSAAEWIRKSLPKGERLRLTLFFFMSFLAAFVSFLLAFCSSNGYSFKAAL